MKMTVAKRHLAINVQGFLENYRRRSMAGLVTNDDGSKCTDAEARQFFYDHLKQGHTVIPTCDPKECPDFDYTGDGCPGMTFTTTTTTTTKFPKRNTTSALPLCAMPTMIRQMMIY